MAKPESRKAPTGKKRSKQTTKHTQPKKKKRRVGRPNTELKGRRAVIQVVLGENDVTDVGNWKGTHGTKLDRSAIVRALLRFLVSTPALGSDYPDENALVDALKALVVNPGTAGSLR